MKFIIVAAALVCPGSAVAAPVMLICTGELSAGGKTVTVANESAIIDFEEGTFKPPLYSSFPLLKVKDTDLLFGRDSQTLSVWGSLDRISGSLAMNVMEPADREKLRSGKSAHFLAWMTAKCVPAQRLF